LPRLYKPITNFLYNLYWFINQWEQSPEIFALKILSVVISLVMIYFIIKLLIESETIKGQLTKLNTFLLSTQYEQKRTLKSWKKVIGLVRSGDENSYKKAILAADDLLNEILERSGWIGSDLGEKVAQVKSIQLPDIDKLMASHQIAEKIREDSNFKVTYEEAIKTLTIYEKLFRDFTLL